MFGNKKIITKDTIDKDLLLYERERELQINEDIQKRKETNWQLVDDARHKRFEQIVPLREEIAKLEAKRDSLKEIIKAQESINMQKDLEIARLNQIVTNLINKIPTAITIQNQR